MKISEFNDIVIEMLPDENYLPHVYATYRDYEAMFSINSGALMEGEFPKKEKNLVAGWILLHKNEIRENWDKSLADENFMMRLIPPL